MSQPIATKTALISECDEYRYRLTRTYDVSLKRVLWILLNPSTADAEQDDPTLRRCIGFSRAWGYGGNVELVNLFAFRSPEPDDLPMHPAPVGPDNDQHILEATQDPENAIVVCAWGRHGRLFKRDKAVIELLRPICDLHVLKSPVTGLSELCSTGEPKHPLYLRGSCVPDLFWDRKVEA